VFGRTLDFPSGTRIVVVGALMALVLILRPSGLTGGRELPLPRALMRSVLTKFSA
jgi:branched-chain amino acid transport system permease protein